MSIFWICQKIERIFNLLKMLTTNVKRSGCVKRKISRKKNHHGFGIGKEIVGWVFQWVGGNKA